MLRIFQQNDTFPLIFFLTWILNTFPRSFWWLETIFKKRRKWLNQLRSIFFWQASSWKLYLYTKNQSFQYGINAKTKMIIFDTISILCSCRYVIWSLFILFSGVWILIHCVYIHSAHVCCVCTRRTCVLCIYTTHMCVVCTHNAHLCCVHT